MLDAPRGSDCITAMRINALALLVISTLALVGTGCVSTLDGRKEAGNPLVKTDIVRVYERPTLECWAATKDVLAVNGTVFSEDLMQSTVSARVDTRTVRVKVEEMDKKMTRLTVQVRTRYGNSDLDLAGEIDKQIALQLASGQPAKAPTILK